MKVAFYIGANGTWLEKQIAKQEPPYRYSHVELVFSDGKSFSSSSRDGGVRFKDIIFDEGKWDYIPVDVTNEQEATARQWATSKIGGWYDWPGVLAFKLPFLRQLTGAWFCSEIVTAALQQMGMLLDKKPSKISPDGLYLLMGE